MKIQFVYQPENPHDWSDSLPGPDPVDLGIETMAAVPDVGDVVELRGVLAKVNRRSWTPGVSDQDVTVLLVPLQPS